MKKYIYIAIVIVLLAVVICGGIYFLPGILSQFSSPQQTQNATGTAPAPSGASSALVDAMKNATSQQGVISAARSLGYIVEISSGTAGRPSFGDIKDPVTQKVVGSFVGPQQ